MRTTLDFLASIRTLIIIHSISLIPPVYYTRITENVLTGCALLRVLENHVADRTLKHPFCDRSEFEVSDLLD